MRFAAAGRECNLVVGSVHHRASRSVARVGVLWIEWLAGEYVSFVSTLLVLLSLPVAGNAGFPVHVPLE